MVPHQYLGGALVVRRRELCVLLLLHLDSAPEEIFEEKFSCFVIIVCLF